jgi:hypothetical protein
VGSLGKERRTHGRARESANRVSPPVSRRGRAGARGRTGPSGMKGQEGGVAGPIWPFLLFQIF